MMLEPSDHDVERLILRLREDNWTELPKMPSSLINMPKGQLEDWQAFYTIMRNYMRENYLS